MRPGVGGAARSVMPPWRAACAPCVSRWGTVGRRNASSRRSAATGIVLWRTLDTRCLRTCLPPASPAGGCLHPAHPTPGGARRPTTARPATTPIRRRPPFVRRVGRACANSVSTVARTSRPAGGVLHGLWAASLVPSPPGPVASLAAAPELSQTVVTPPDQRGSVPSASWSRSCAAPWPRTAAGGTRFDLDTLYSVMQELHDLAQDVVRPYGGRLHPVIGDRLLILFGVPVAHEDDARRAVRVALELRRRLSGAPGAPWDGVRAPPGAAAWACIQDWWWWAVRQGRCGALPPWWEMSSPWPWCSRSRRRPGQILCSDATARLVQGTVRLEAVEPVQLPGQPTPVTTYAVLGRRGRRAPGWSSAGGGC